MSASQTSVVSPSAAYQSAPVLALVIAILLLQPLAWEFYLGAIPSSLKAMVSQPVDAVNLMISLYTFTFGAAQFITAPLSDRFGRRPVLTCALVTYALAALVYTFVPNVELMFAARLIQAASCSAAIVVARAMVCDTYSANDSVRVIARASTWLSVAMLLATAIGYALAYRYGWRVPFYVMTLVAALTLAAVMLRLTETKQHKNPGPSMWAEMIANYRLVLGARVFWANALPGALSFGVVATLMTGAEYVMRQVLHQPLSDYSHSLLYAASAYFSGTLLCRRLLFSRGTLAARRIGGGIALSAGLFFLVIVAAGVADTQLLTQAMFFAMLAHGVNAPIAQAAAVAAFPQRAATAAGLMGAFNCSMAFVCAAVVPALFNGTAYPLALMVCALGVAIFAAVRLGRNVAQEVQA